MLRTTNPSVVVSSAAAIAAEENNSDRFQDRQFSSLLRLSHWPLSFLLSSHLFFLAKCILDCQSHI